MTANGGLLTGDKLRVLEVVAVVLPIRSLVDELRVARIAGSPQFEPAGQTVFRNSILPPIAPRGYPELST